MNNVFKKHLFNKQILVCDGEPSKNPFECLYLLANSYGFKITNGANLVQDSHVEYVAEMLGKKVPEPFYKGFPKSVRKLSKEQLLFDQLFHYFITYGLDDFSNPGYSVFEKDFERLAFKERGRKVEYIIITEDEANEIIKETVQNLLSSTRPLSEFQFSVALNYLKENTDYVPEKIASLNTCVKLFLETDKVELLKNINLSQVIKIVEEINYTKYKNKNLKKLNFSSADRKFITLILDYIFENGFVDTLNCFEKKKVWCGLLHHLHYVGKNEKGKEFVSLIRSNKNDSVYARAEKAIQSGNVKDAISIIKKSKGATLLLRQLNYFLSRCKTQEDVDFLIENLESNNVIVLIQLLLQYKKYNPNKNRVFKFTKFNKLSCHIESEEEQKRRKTLLTSEQIDLLSSSIFTMLEKALKGKLGKVYLAPNMENYAMPISEATGSSGFGVLPKGSKIPLPKDKKIRAFTYWEKVNDIDLSVIGLCEDGTQKEFSWRSMYDKQSKAVTFSGDQTSGFNGGSEYFDIDVKKFKAEYPEVKNLIFCNTVYSLGLFDDCFCRAGYMIRDKKDSGKVFEPKTVETAFTITTKSTMVYLFGLNLDKSEIVWLNVGGNSYSHVAGKLDLKFLEDYFDICDVFNLKQFFTMAATEIVSNKEDADVIVTDQNDLPIIGEKEIIHPYDIDKLLALLNK